MPSPSTVKVSSVHGAKAAILQGLRGSFTGNLLEAGIAENEDWAEPGDVALGSVRDSEILASMADIS